MACATYKNLCKNLVISQGVSFSNNTLVINLPTGVYEDNRKYCIVVAQNIPDTATVTAPVVVTIGTEETTYPLLNSDYTPVYACSINKRTRYSTNVHTSINSGVFTFLTKLPCSRCTERLNSLPAPVEV